MQKLTVLIPTGNEERNIEEVLKSVDFADEILVVDSFSTDRTLELARKYPTRIIQREYGNNASQKNWAIPQATHEWILVVDADERVTPELREGVQEILRMETEPYVAYVIYQIEHFMGKQMNYSGLQTSKATRLFKRDKCRYEEKQAHAEIIADGAIGVLKKGKLKHNTYKDFDSFMAKLNRYAWWQAGDLEKRMGKITIWHVVLKPIYRFLTHYIIRFGFLDGFPGFCYAYTQGYAVMTRYFKVWLIRKGLK